MSGQKVETLLSDTQNSLKSTTELCNNIANTEDLPPVFKEVEKCVCLVQEILQVGQDQLQTGTLDIEDEELLADLKNSKKEALHLNGIFKVIAPPSETTPAQRYQEVVRKRSKDRVEDILLKLLEGINRLVTKDLIAASDEQASTLGEVMEEVKGSGSEGKEEGKGAGNT
ncbi:hypothetical protein G7Y89_g8892 [Cudoniella acicularis]|uniref:NACHT-NTPase and P-loop NTPases N-terminal domain-containing protein n=1 Tax=Cudoniella acicularis TaxID=354080 RepID=A0A8H4RIC4_9HELO|nr:hypothetical protein G7Y89_g8892 [Cudoniella acicularis]